MDLEGDDDDLSYKPKSSRKGFFAAVLGLAAIAGGVAFASQRGMLKLPGGSHDDIASVAAAAAMAAPPPPAAEPVVAPTPPPPVAAPVIPVAATPAPANAAPAEASPLNPSFTNRFNEDTKSKLLANDRARDAKSKARHAASAGGSARPSSSKSKSTVFTTGGNKYDPLNSAI
jgi:hypothetical protein